MNILLCGFPGRQASYNKNSVILFCHYAPSMLRCKDQLGLNELFSALGTKELFRKKVIY